RADRTLKTPKGAILMLLIVTTFYGYGAGAGANMIFDRADATVFSAQVVSKQVINGKSTRYRLYLSPWGPQQQIGDVSISRRWYDSIQPRDTVCPVLHPGALHIPWYTVHPCAKQ